MPFGNGKLKASRRRTDHGGSPPALAKPIRQIPGNEKAPVINDYRGLVLFNNGGEIGILTLGTGEGTTDFESVPFGHSGISPTARIITTLSSEANPLSEIFLCFQMLASVKAVRPDDWRLLRRLR